MPDRSAIVFSVLMATLGATLISTSIIGVNHLLPIPDIVPNGNLGVATPVSIALFACPRIFLGTDNAHAVHGSGAVDRMRVTGFGPGTDRADFAKTIIVRRPFRLTMMEEDLAPIRKGAEYGRRHAPATPAKGSGIGL